MGLKAGIIGLPNVGKSTLFNAITSNQVEAANYPFATINPNSGTVELNDERIDKLISLFNPKKTIKATFEFCDIAGLVKGASKGEGLGNQFLANIRDVDALCHVVRCFENDDILHVEGSVDAIRDAEIINMELIFSDMDVVEKRIGRIEKRAVATKDKELTYELGVLQKVLNALREGTSVQNITFDSAEEKIVRGFNLLTSKPVIYVANILEEEISDPDKNQEYLRLIKFAKEEDALVIPISAQIEAEISTLEEAERKDFLREVGIEVSGLDKLTHAAYSLLGLETFFTVGQDEVRAWTFKEGMKAPECAGIIHTDFQRGFIKAEVYSYDDIVELGSEAKIKENGRLRIEGKEYVVKDGDIIHFRFNV